MPPTLTGTAEGAPRHPRYPGLRTAPFGELAAAIAIAALLAELLLAQLTLVLSIAFVIIGRSGRWRWPWLVAPAALGLAWMLSIGIRPALAGYVAGAGHVLRYLTGSGSVIARLAHLAGAFGGWRQWLPRQLPVALVAAAAQTACANSLGSMGRRDAYRPGLIIAVRRRYLTAVIRKGEVATSDGGCVGITRRTARRAAISWCEAESGVLCTGQNAAAVVATGLGLASAAIQRRKTVIIVDLAGDDARFDGDIGLTASITQACADAGAPLRSFGDQGGCYEPLPGASPARAADLVLAMIDWRGVSHAQRRFCADYLNAALAVIAATAAGPQARPVVVLDELTGLLQPGALGAGLRRASGCLPGLEPLAGRLADLAGQLDNDPALTSPVAVQLAGLRSAGLGSWLRPARGAGQARPAGQAAPVGAGHRPMLVSPVGGGFAGRSGRRSLDADETQISLGRALADREVVFFGLDHRLHGPSAIMIARLVAADLTAILAQRGALGAAADCLVWISGCEVLDPGQLTVLIAAGAGTGTAVLLGTAAWSAATRLASDVNVVMVRGPAPPALAGMLGSPDPARPAHDLLASGPAYWIPGTEQDRAGPGTMPLSGSRPPATFSFSTNDSTGRSAADLLGQRPDEVSLLVRSPRQRLLLRATAAR